MTIQLKGVGAPHLCHGISYMLKKFNIDDINLITVVSKPLSDEYAFVELLEDDCKRISYKIWVDNSISDRQQIFALVHEMTHINQFHRKRLKLIDNEFIWLGNINNEEYDEQPWEIEAWKSELIHGENCWRWAKRMNN